MRAVSGELRLRRRVAEVTAAAMVIALLCAPAGAQDTSPIWTVPSAQRRGPPGQRSEEPEDQSMRRAEKEAAKQRNLQRQRRIVSETERIVLLAQEFKKTVDSGDKQQLVSAAKKAEEIEKLARSVKNRMKGE